MKQFKIKISDENQLERLKLNVRLESTWHTRDAVQ